MPNHCHNTESFKSLTRFVRRDTLVLINIEKHLVLVSGQAAFDNCFV